MISAILGAIAVQVADDLPFQKPTARDLYVSCYLLVRETPIDEEKLGKEPFSPARCALFGIKGITFYEGKRPDQEVSFCLPNDLGTASDPNRAMATAYLDFYEQTAPAIASKDGELAFFYALTRRYPCAK